MGLFGGKKKQGGIPSPGYTCPNCGSTNVRIINGGPVSFPSSPILDNALDQDDWMNMLQCQDCGYQWQAWG